MQVGPCNLSTENPEEHCILPPGIGGRLTLLVWPSVWLQDTGTVMARGPAEKTRLIKTQALPAWPWL